MAFDVHVWRIEERKIRMKHVGQILLAISISAFAVKAQDKAIQLIVPSQGDSISYDQGKLLVLSVMKEKIPNLLVSAEWKFTKFMDVAPKVQKDNFPKDFYKLFDPKTTLRQFVYAYRFFGGWARPDTMSFRYQDTISIRSLWSKPILAKFAENAQSPDVLGVMVSVSGWKDSLYTPVYDDPNNDARALYKIHVQLVPGVNLIEFGSAADKFGGMEYQTSFNPDYKTIADREYRFHNSEAEQSCTTCHEGLPSADKGKSMKADCAVCHKTFAGASFLHAPVEMKECKSCHAWSAKKKVVATIKAVPELCYDCHVEKKELVESAAVPHPVASECLTCHSPHGTNVKHQLKTDIFTLCGGCHDKYAVNHPVGRHPVRFAKVSQTGEEISCTSCHNPHGSANASLLRASGGRMSICLQCHDK
jgi:predicted CXXCH cytochrome family protein